MIDITTFGFFQDGMLALTIQMSMLDFSKEIDSIGFTLDKSSSDGSASYMVSVLTSMLLTCYANQTATIVDLSQYTGWGVCDAGKLGKITVCG